MPAKKGKRDAVKADTPPENTEEPVVKKGRGAAAPAEKVKKGPAGKPKAKKAPEEEPPLEDVEAEEEPEVEAKNGAPDDKPKRGRAKKDATKQTEPVEKRELRGRKAKLPPTVKDEPAPKVSKVGAKPPGKRPTKETKEIKETKTKGAKTTVAKEEEPLGAPASPESPKSPKEPPKTKGKGKGRGKTAAVAEENVVDEKGDAKVGTAAEGADAASVEVEACKS